MTVPDSDTTSVCIFLFSNEINEHCSFISIVFSAGETGSLGANFNGLQW